MLSLSYLFAKALKKARGISFLDSIAHLSSKIESGTSFVDSTMARHSFCGYDCSIINCDIGAFCSIANGVSIGGGRHPVEFVSTSPVFLSHRDSVKAKFAEHTYLPKVRTTVGNDVWIGERAFIKAGVTVGDGSVVGMASVVTKDVPAYAIVAGNPAKVIRMRFEKQIIDALLQMRWWDLPEPELLRLGPLFDNPEVMLKHEGFM